MADDRQPFTIAIDGPAGAGKSTVGERLAERLRATFFDTGVLYRAVTLLASRRNVPVSDAEGLADIATNLDIHVGRPTLCDGRQCDVIVDGEDVSWSIRTTEVDKSVSEVSAHAKVRQALLPLQRRIGHSGRVVMVGRDVGTVVMPDADLKIYLSASLEERARRRYMQPHDSERTTNYEHILEEIRRRDRLDRERTLSPLKPADDAAVIETDGESIDDVVRRIESLVEDQWPQRRVAEVGG